MGRVSWPIRDIRRDPLGIWHLLSISGETFTVPATPDDLGQYVIWLVEIPAPVNLDGTNLPPAIYVNSQLLQLVTHYPSSSLEVFVDYMTGQVLFHPAQAGRPGYADYSGKGSLVEAADINDLNTRLRFIEAYATGELGHTGLPGTMGNTGIQGSLGATGARGLQGDPGATGIQGSTGTKGNTGLAGPAGIGYQGTQGTRGATGIQGVTGSSGNMGSTGLQGQPGATGVRGITGLQGALVGRYESPVLSGTSWVVNHNLGSLPVIQTFDLSGQLLSPSSILNGSTGSQVAFSTSKTGFAICVVGGEQGPRGPTGIGLQGATGPTVVLGRYEQNFFPPSPIWTLSHNLGEEPIIQVYDNSDRLLNPTGIQNGVMQSTVYFTSPQEGVAFALVGGRAGVTGPAGTTIDSIGISINLSGGATTIQSGIAGDLRIMNSGTIQRVSLVSGETGTMQLDLWRSTYQTFPPTVVNSIVGGNPIRIVSGIKGQNTGLVGWNREVSRGDCLRVNVDVCSYIKNATLLLEMIPAYTPSYSSSSSSSSSSR